MVSSVARTSSPRPWGCGFYVPYEVRDAGSGKGNGVFAKEPIAAGTLIWHGDDDVCRWYSESEFRALLPTLSSDEIRYKLNHAYAMSEVNHEKIIELPRDAGSVNHSSQPNSVTPYVYEAQTGRRVDPSQWPLPAGQRVYLYNACVALRDIAAGEELVENYHEFHNPAWYVHLCREYGVESAEAVAHTYG